MNEEQKRYLENFFRSVFTTVSKTNEPLEGLCFCNFYTQNNMISFCVSEYDTRNTTIEIIEYVDFIISSFVTVTNGVFKIDSYYICFQMFKIMNKSCVHNSSETILQFLEKKYPDIKFFQNELIYSDKLLISKM